MQIGSRKIKPETIVLLIKDIKKKKELQNLAEEFIAGYVKKYLAQNAKAISFLEEKFNQKSTNYKQIIKNVRAELRRTHSLFGVDLKKREKYFDELINTPNKLFDKGFNLFSTELLELHKKVLTTHSSTKERLDFYETFYHKLFKITGFPKTILDVGCGINPLSIPLMKLKNLTYYAYDINRDEVNLVEKYFLILSKNFKSFQGTSGILNSLKIDQIKKLPQADLCLLLKMTDVLDRGKGHKISEQVISNIPAKYVVVSFPTITVSGKAMNQPRRKWIELMCERLKYTYTIITEKNEIFYIVKK